MIKALSLCRKLLAGSDLSKLYYKRLETSRSLHSFLSRLWTACFLSFAFFRISITPYTDSVNRFYFSWQRTDALAILLLVLGGGLILFLAYETLGNAGSLGCLFRDLMFLTLGFFYVRVALLEVAFGNREIPVLLVIASKTIHASLLIWFLWKPSAAIRFLRNTCLVFSPIVLIFSYTILSAQPMSRLVRSSTDSVVQPSSELKIRRVMLILFDELSYDRLFANGEIMEDYPNFRRLAARSLTFHDAHSPAGCATLQSVPQMLIGAKAKVVLDRGKPMFELEDGLIRAAEPPNIFRAFRRQGFRTVWVGNHLPCGEFFPSDLDYGETWGLYKPLNHSITEAAFWILLQHLGKRLPFFAEQATRLRRRLIFSNALSFDDWIHGKAFEVLRDKRQTLAFVHYRMPHAPYIYNQDGFVTTQGELGTLQERYKGALRAADRKLGDLLDLMEHSGRADNTVFVVTSDHGFRKDPEQKRESRPKTHVPLFVQAPAYGKRQDITNEVRTINLKEAIFKCVFVPNCGVEELEHILGEGNEMLLGE
jgi:hypothetical protein